MSGHPFRTKLILSFALFTLLRNVGAAMGGTFLNIYLDDHLHVSTAQIGLLLASGQIVAAPAALCAWTGHRALQAPNWSLAVALSFAFATLCHAQVLFAAPAIVLPDGVEMVMPGDNVTMQVELIEPIAMEEGLRFAIREGGRTVGAGVVGKILE